MNKTRFERFLLWALNPKVAVPLLIVVVLLAAPFIYRSSQLAGLPDIGDPFDVEAFGTVEISDDENAFIEYIDATALLVLTAIEPHTALEKVQAAGWSAADEEIRSLLDDNRAAMNVWREGTRKPDALYHQPYTVRFDTLLPVTRELRNFASLALLEGSRLEAEGDLTEAWQWFRAIFRCSRHKGQHGTMIDRLGGASMYIIAAEAMEKWSRDPRVTAAQLREALKATRADYELTPRTSTIYKVGYLVWQKSAQELTPSELIRLLRSHRVSRGIPEELVRVQLFLKNEPQMAHRVAQHAFTNMLEHLDKPRHARPPQTHSQRLFQTPPSKSLSTTTLSAEQIEASIQRSPVARELLERLYSADDAAGREQARQAALVVALAVQIYRREQGEFPDKAEDLLNGILNELPTDPYGKAGETMHYRRDPTGFTVWSVGANKTDDGGFVDGPGWDPESADIGFEVEAETAERNDDPQTD
jgi:hypothetical protein